MDSDVIFTIDSKPRYTLTALLGLQYAIKFASLLIFPVLIIQMAHLSTHAATLFLSTSILSCAIVTLLLMSKKFGAGCFIAATSSPALFAASVLAVSVGGLSALAGLVIMVGILQLILTPLLLETKILFSKTMAGNAFLSTGIWVGLLGVHELFYPSTFGELLLHTDFLKQTKGHIGSILIGIFSLAIMVGIRIYGKTKYRPLCILWGIILAWLLAALTGNILPHYFADIKQAPWFILPHLIAPQGYHFNKSLMIAVILSCIVLIYEIYGSVYNIYFEGSHKDAFKPSIALKANAISSIGTIVSGIMGCTPVSPNPGSNGIMLVTGAFNRSIGFAFSFCLMLLCVCPKIMTLLLTIPAAVNGAVLIFTGAAMITSSFKIIDIHHIKGTTGLAFCLSLNCAMFSIALPSHVQALLPKLFGISELNLLVATVSFAIFSIIFNLPHFLSSWKQIND